MTPHEFTISASELDAAGKHYVFPVRATWLRGALEDHEATTSGVDGELDVRASKSGHDVVIHGTLRAELTAPCARCLEPVRIPVDHPVTVLLVPSSQLGPPHSPNRGSGGKDRATRKEEEERELSAEEADTLTYDGDTVVLDDFVRGELMLETPMIPLCSEDCPGMRPPPSHSDKEAPERAKDAIDPRLLPLMRFASQAQKAKKE
jgi:uncharacterized protein